MYSLVDKGDNCLIISFEEGVNFYDLVSELRYRLNVIAPKSINIPLVIKIKNHLNDTERKELEETIKRFNIKFYSIK